MRTAALLGMPLTRRHSAEMHNAAFRSNDIEAEYILREVDEHELPAEIERARAERWLGFQITAPHKQAIMPLLDEVEPDAAAIGAVNSVEVTDDGRLIGFNTDVLGFLAAIEPLLTKPITESRVVVGGSGGVAHAVVYGLGSRGPQALTVADLRLADSERLRTEYAEHFDLEATTFNHHLLEERLGEADLFVNATSVGMLTPGPVVPVASIARGAAVFDVVYVPRTTELTRQAAAAGHPTANGDEMLVAQAVAAFVRWTGAPDPSVVMRAAVEPLLDDPDTRP